MHKLANALLEMAKPTINKLADDGIGNQMAERELDAALKAVKLAKSIYEIDLMKRKMEEMGTRMDEYEYEAKPASAMTSAPR